ncbi:MAG: hypothetical protein DI601_11250 [Azospirillum brasilense]|nr:MAG: hypothetical protein DI601_11250 [Azospirillum brasilense]
MAGQGHEAEDGAERAFEALRAEVAGLRRQMEALRAPDYDASLGALAREVRGLGGRLQQAIEAARPPEMLRLPGEETVLQHRLSQVEEELARLVAACTPPERPWWSWHAWPGRLAMRLLALALLLGTVVLAVRQASVPGRWGKGMVAEFEYCEDAATRAGQPVSCSVTVQPAGR